MMAIQLDVLLGACLAIQNANLSSMFRIVDLFLAILFIGAYLSFLFFIVKMTYKIMTSDKDKLLKTHYKTKFKNWLFIVEPLVELKKDSELDVTRESTLKELDDSQQMPLSLEQKKELKKKNAS